MQLHRSDGILYNIIKTHVRGFFDTDLYKVNWHFATHKAKWILNSPDRVKISVREAIQNGLMFLSYTWKVNTVN